MSARRIALATGQLLVVGALLAVIYVTLLQPEGDDSLFGVDAPQEGPEMVREPPRDDRARDRDRAARRGEGRVRRGRFAGLGAPPPPAGFAPGVPSPEGEPDGRPPPGGDPSPGDDQYSDTLARLEAMLDRGRTTPDPGQ